MTDYGVGSLRVGSRGIPIEIRVIRRWHPRYRDQDTCYIFLDKQNNAIQAFSIAKDQLIIDSRLEVMGCYHIKGYACTSIEKNTCVINNPVVIRMGAATILKPIPDTSDIPRIFFSFGNYDDIRRISLNREGIIDYIGVLESIEDGKTKKTGKPYVNLRIFDSSNELIAITLWEEIATVTERFPRQTIQHAEKPTIIAATSLRFNQYTGQMDLQSTPATHVYLNPNHPVSTSLLNGYDPNILHQRNHLTLNATKAEKITLTELLMKGHSLPTEKAYMCEVYIDDFIPSDAWYYIACMKCNGLAHTSDNSWFCTDCGDITEIKYKSRVVAYISDGVSQAKATIFDDTLEVLLHKPFRDLITKDGYDDNTCLPEPILRTRGDRRNFILKQQREQYSYGSRFIVKQILPLDEKSTMLMLETPTTTTPPHNPTISKECGNPKKKLKFKGDSSSSGDIKKFRHK